MIHLEGVRVDVPVPGATGGPWTSKTLLHDITCVLAERRIAFIGANGSGKSTLLRLLNGLTLATAGSVTVDGLDPVRDGAAVRQHVGFVFTDPLSQLLMPTPIEDVELSLRRVMPQRAERRARALELLAERGLDRVAEQSIYDLSGGERQLVALTAVLAVEPGVLVADEPTTLLDRRNARAITDELARLPQQVVLVTHHLDLLADWDRVVVIDEGRVVADGQPGPTLRFYRDLTDGALDDATGRHSDGSPRGPADGAGP